MVAFIIKNYKISGIEIETSLPNLSQWWDCLWTAFITSIPICIMDFSNHPHDSHICCYPVYKEKWTMVTKWANWRISAVEIRGLTKTNLISEKGTGLTGEGSFYPAEQWQAQSQCRNYFHLILCNSQLEQLILQRVMLPSSGISIESFMTLTRVHCDSFWQLLSPKAENIHWLWSVILVLSMRCSCSVSLITDHGKQHVHT